MLGTLINMVTVAVGSTTGLVLKNKLPKPIIKIIFQVLGVFTIFLGIDSTFQSNDYLTLVIGVIVGAIIGQSLKLEERLEKLATRLDPEAGEEDSTFTKGLMTAFMLFCVGTLTVLGCFQEGIAGDRKLLITKSFMDLFSSAALATAFGKGVLFSIIPLFLFQGGLTLGAQYIEPLMNGELQAELSGAGGLMLIALGLNILDIVKIRVVNLLPGLLTTVLLAALGQHFGFYNVL